ncbi:MAG: hypothetical protein ABJB16_15945 [Saprospiraceae bacterium]
MQCLNKYHLLIFSLFSMTRIFGQDALMNYDSAFQLKATWQEYMPDAFALNDSTYVMAGLTTNMSSLTVNIFLRWMNTDGTVLREKEIFDLPNSEGYSYALNTFYKGSAIDHEYIYVLTASDESLCSISGNMVRANRLVKVQLSDGDVLIDTLFCADNIPLYNDIMASALQDSLYLYGTIGYLNENPKKTLTVLSKDLVPRKIYMLKTDDTTILPIGMKEDPRSVAGSHGVYDFDPNNTQDIWMGHIVGDSVRQDYTMKYFSENYLFKTFVIDEHEKAYLALQLFFPDESSIYLLRDDTLAWNFYDTFYEELTDIQRIGANYCILQADFRDMNDQKDKIVLHYLDYNGFPYGSDAFTAPWIRFAMNGLLIGPYYFVFVYCSDQDELQAVIDNQLPITEARYEYTHVFKFRIHE